MLVIHYCGNDNYAPISKQAIVTQGINAIVSGAVLLLPDEAPEGINTVRTSVSQSGSWVSVSFLHLNSPWQGIRIEEAYHCSFIPMNN